MKFGGIYMRNIKKLISIIALSVMIIGNVLGVVYADERTMDENLYEIIEELSGNNSYFEEFLTYTSIVEIPLDDVALELLMYYDGDEYIGYTIWDSVNNALCEISKSYPSYVVYMQNNPEIEDAAYVYSNGNYSIVTEDTIVYLDEFGNEYDMSESNTSTYGLLPNVNPQLQGSNNCIVAAVANLFYYWSQHGYSQLNYRNSYAGMKSQIDSLFDGYYANNSIPSVASRYVRECGLSNTVTSNVYWDPSISRVTNEIDAGRPCLVGFAAGSSYSSTVGHMTMCCGYECYNGYQYIIAVVDGHNVDVVYKNWSYTYNDCVITVQIVN